MAMEEDLITRLAGVSGIAALVGDRISWFGRQRGDALPALMLSKISPGREWTHTGPDGLDQPRVQFECWAASDGDVVALARVLRDALEISADVGTTRFHPAMIDGGGWSDEGEQDGGAQLFRISQDYLFFHETL